jgi:signal transduction histidine kinase/CheY-like chemotaxis protein
MGWAPYVPAQSLDAHLEAVRRGGAPDYRVRPPPDGRDAFGPVVYLEPFTGRNPRALGVDMYQDPPRRLAMQEARDKGAPSLSTRLPLSEGKEQPPEHGFFVYMPAYRPGAPTDTVEQRRAALLGWAYASFRSADFLQSALGADHRDLYLEVRDGGTAGATMVAAGEPPRADVPPALQVPVRMVNRDWRVDAWPVVRARTAGLSASDAVAIGGALATLLLFGIVWTLACTRSRALAIADRMTVALRQSNETLEARVRERTASLRESNERLARVNDKLGSVNAALQVIGAPGPMEAHLGAIAAHLRRILPAEVALAVAFRAEAAVAPVVGLDADAALPVAERERWRRAAERSDRSGTPPAETDGATLPYRLQAPLHDALGRVRGYLMLGRETGGFPPEDTAVLSQFALLAGTSLSLNETLARERNARAEAERADRTKDEMLAVVSHELRTPLNAIQGWLYVLRQRRSDDASLLDRAVKVIQRNLDTQLQLVDDLLDTAHGVTGKLRLDLHPLDLVSVLNGALEAVRPMAESKGVSLSLRIADERFDTVGDPSRLQQVVWNLLSNAVKFTPPGGSVSLRLERLGWLAQIEVEDTGQGIEAAFLPHVFERFRRADSSSTRSTGGLGLGLALVQHIVQAHGGQVMVRSQGSGLGACFTVSLPLGMSGLHDGSARQRDGKVDAWTGVVSTPLEDPPGEADTAVAADAGTPGPLAGLTVLVVEDHDDSRELLAEFLVTQGARVLTAANGHEAMAGLRSIGDDEPPPVLLCDIGLPGEDGYALLARIRRHEHESGRWKEGGLVAYALSAFTRDEDRERSLAAGFAEHLPKPLVQTDLVARLGRLRDRPVPPWTSAGP